MWHQSHFVKNYNSTVCESVTNLEQNLIVFSFGVPVSAVLAARYGLNGHDCLLRTLCEAKERLKTGNSLVEDILQVVFR
jgi:hypothetical protein